MRNWKKTLARLQGGGAIVLILVLLGLGLRVAGLGSKVFWVDEVATAIRIAGFTKPQLVALLATGQRLTPADLLAFQHFTPAATLTQTLAALQRSPEHAPLYFLLAHFWAGSFGSDPAALRSLSVLFSGLCLPAVGWLSWQLFASHTAAGLSVSLMAVSPFFVAYAQEARPYSLWALVLLSGSVLLLRAMRTNGWQNWGLYALSAAIGLYTSVLSAVVLVGQGLYVAGVAGAKSRFRRWLVAVGVAAVAFLPWVWVMVSGWGQVQENTAWMREGLGVVPLVAVWLYSFAILFFDVPVFSEFGPIGVLTLLVALGVLSFIGVAIVRVCQQPRRVWLLLLTLICVTPLTLMATDLIGDSQLSTAARYLLPFHLGSLVAVAYLLAVQMKVGSIAQQQKWRWSFAILVAICLISCGFQLVQPPKYLKSRSLHNAPIATAINQIDRPLLVAESSQTIDLVSLSYQLKPDIVIQILPDIHFPIALQNETLLVFNPSDRFAATLRDQDFALRAVYQPERLVPSEITLSLWQATPLN